MPVAVAKLIRLPNLLLVALTQWLLYHEVLRPAFALYQISFRLNYAYFLIYVGVTLLITAGGYTINDIVDRDADLANRPDRVVIGRFLSLQSAYWLYIFFSLFGFFLAVYLAFYVDKLPLLGIYPLAVGLLYAYSVWLKKQPLIGNLVVALFCAGVPASVWLAEFPSIKELCVVAPSLGQKVVNLFSWYTSFAFLVNLFREIVKDLEDMSGDALVGYRTTPIAWGASTAKIVACISGISLLGLLVYYGFIFQRLFGAAVIAFLIFALILPLIISFQRLLIAREKRQYHRISTMIKLIMLSGIVLLVLANI